MPSMHLFGRRWALGTDDFVFSSVTEGIVRIFWSCIMVAMYFIVFHTSTGQETPCQRWQVKFFVLSLMLLNTMMIVLNIAMALVSARGTITNTKPRRNIGYIIYLRISLFFFELAVTIFATVTVFDLGECSNQPLQHFIIAVVVLEWVVILAFLIILLLMFDPLGALHHYEHSMARDHARGVWKQRLRCMCAFANADDNAKNAFEDIADLMTDFFLESDLVASDIWAGMILLASKDYAALHKNPAKVLCKANFDSPCQDWMTIENGARMMHFALAVYGWPYYMWNNCNPRSWCQLLRGTKCCAKLRCDQAVIQQDNCCLCNAVAFQITTEIRSEDMFYVSFRNQIYQSPFAACADPMTKSIIVTIRGTLSLRDIITDLAMHDEMLPLDDIDYAINQITDQQPTRSNAESPTTGVRVHRGMMKSANFVLRQLNERKILDDLFVLYPDYNLVITGHSLGAGVAVIVALLLRKRYPNVRCFAFSPPGCVVSENGIPLTQEFVFSIIVGDDLVPRLSYNSMCVLHENILDAISHCDRAKYEILLKGCFKLLCTKKAVRRMSTGTESFLDASNQVTTPRQCEEQQLSADARKRRLYGSSSDINDVVGDLSPENDQALIDVAETPLLRCPGRILQVNVPKSFIHKTLDDDDEEQCTIEWLDCTSYSMIKMSSRMLNDHMPTYVKDVLDKVVLARSLGRVNEIEYANRQCDNISERSKIVAD